ncbi:hypothetical protein CEUSTIGMA_g10386.t1 [Chlamydomonas eustigma]|uniref:Major facilitator superfamily (MFS) profile domain-containing protein n=1 Tax=Chlamydomonas eustigma TaxID=1157962 RepID=A0A250XJ63_9CHLO|nr:hypothetical protein CEUSTIGMA_g10386.t1 [Chlamydomonas eustigma]|eukprot:GAX82959.1 hypothetical protein CEUSTIGMA_g10386.t1 [Chlamydomonas eustigma]
MMQSSHLSSPCKYHASTYHLPKIFSLPIFQSGSLTKFTSIQNVKKSCVAFSPKGHAAGDLWRGVRGHICAATSSGVLQSQEMKAANPFLNVVLPTAITLLLCNMDRICLSVAILPISKEFAWPASLQGVIQSAFLWGYMATQFIGGSLADKYGGKLVMAGGIAWFSLASLLMPLALSEPVVAAGYTIPAVLFARCMVGLGEGVALPTMNNLMATHIPKAARSRALGLSFSGFHCGNLLGLILSPILLLQFGWRSLFLIFGFLGAPLLALWMATVPATAPIGGPDKAAAPSSVIAGATESTVAEVPAASTSSSGQGYISFRWSTTKGSGSGEAGFRSVFATTATAAAEAAVDGFKPSSSSSFSSPLAAAASVALPEVGVKELLSSTATWAIIIVNIVNHWGYFIYLNWMPTYFNAAMGFDLRSSSFLSFLPWLVMAAGSSAAGLLADTLISKGHSVTTVRKSLQTVAFLIPAVALLVLAQPGLSPGVAVAAMTVALGTTSLGQAGFVANMSDIAPRHAGKMFGLCNTFGSLSGIIGVTAVGFIVEATKSFSTVFLMTAGMYIAATIAWNLMCTGEKVFV